MKELALTPTTPPQNLFSASLKDRWLKFARVTEKSQKTYDTAVKQFFKYLGDNHISTPVKEDVVNWIDSLIAAKKSASTVNLYLTATKLFFRWLADEGIYPNISDHLKSGVKISREHKKDALTTKEGADLLKSITGNDAIACRNRAFIALMLTTGLRTIEVSRANVADLCEIAGRHYLKVHGKGKTDVFGNEMILLPTQVYNLLVSYLSTREKLTPESPIFVSYSRRNYGSRLSTQSVSKLTKKYLRGIGLNSRRYSAHALRHTAAMQMIISGVDVFKVQNVLRHRSIDPTMIYVNLADRLKNTAEQTAADAFFAAM